MKETELEVINHQLQGIMDCTDMMNLFCLLKLNHHYRRHRQRLNRIMATFCQLSQLYINKYQEIPKVSTTFQRAFNIATPESKELIPLVISSWVDWESKGVDLYVQLLEQATDSRERKLWIKLLSMAKMCLQTAKYCKQKYLFQTNQATPVTPVTPVTSNPPSTTADNIRQRMQERLVAIQN